ADLRGQGRRSPRGGAGAAAGATGRPGEPSRPHTARSSEGYEILVGRNNKQNDMITKSAKPDDVWLHARQMPGAHVILRYPRAEGKPPRDWPPEASLIEAAALAAHFSKGRGNTKVPVDYAFARHVWKPRGAKPGMVLYDHQKTVYVEPLNLLEQPADPTGSTPQ
ncbi:MAG: NFACT RNA binding domain-containing protein, partial [Bacillota bacterium]